MKTFSQVLFLSTSAFLLGIISAVFAVVIVWIILVSSGQELQVFLSESYSPADIKIKTTDVFGKVEPLWLAFAQGGEEAGKEMLTSTVDEMKKLSPKYVRLDHIFDDDYYGLVKKDGENLTLDWSKLDKTVADITAMGGVPFFSLGYMPTALADSKISVPRDWNKWQWLVSETIYHYSGKNNKNLSGVYYEVWNEPDLESFGSWFYSGQKSYMNLYNYSARAAASARKDSKVNDFKFGGPGITALYKNWILALVNNAKSNNLPLDFLSWHRYNFYPSRFNQDLNDINNWLGGTGKHSYELIISEWGPDSEKNIVYSGNYSAAHAVSSLREMIDGITWAYAFEVKDGPSQEDKGWGIIRHEDSKGEVKPRYNVFRLLTGMDGERVTVEGEGSNVGGWAVKNGKDISVILSNFSPTGADKEIVPVTFTDLSEGDYLLKWVSLSKPKAQKKYTIGVKKNMQESSQSATLVESSSSGSPIELDKSLNSISQSFTLDPNDVYRLMLTKL